jgi:hypothetical protein
VIEGGMAKLLSPINRLIHWTRKNTVSGSKDNIVAHYDLSNELEYLSGYFILSFPILDMAVLS